MGWPASTVGRALRRRGPGRLSALDPRPSAVRYERERPGGLVHLDADKLGRIVAVGHRVTGDRTGQSSRRGTGWEYLHLPVLLREPEGRLAIDDASRLAYTEPLADERKGTAVDFLGRAPAWFAGHGVRVERVMTDNGSAYASRAFREALAGRGVRHKRTRPYRPQTNGKSERSIQTSLREWAYARPYETSAARAGTVPAWLCGHNARRPHSALGGRPPISRLPKDNLRGNLRGNDI